MTTPNPTTPAPDTGAVSSARAATAAARSSNVREAIAANTKAFLDAFSRGDPASMAAGYTTDGQVLPPNGDIAEGRNAIESFWRETMKLGFAGATLDLVELYHTAGDRIATEVGRYTILGADGQPADRGKYIVIWQRDDEGRWLIHRDMWASNLPLPGTN